MYLRMLLASCIVATMSAVRTGSVEAPQYIRELYQCVKDKTPLECYGVEADSVQSISGKVARVSDNASRLHNYSVTITFNSSSMVELSSQDDVVLAAKLRVYKNALTDKQILALRSSGCDTSLITLQLFVGNTSAEFSQSNVTLTREDLRTGKWIIFGNVADVYNQWVRNATSDVQSLAIVAVGACNTRELGFTASANNSPLFVTFLQKANRNIDFLTAGFGEATISRVQARNAIGDGSPCQLYTYQVVTKEHWSNYGNPEVFEANFCAGVCTAPTAADGSLYTTQHAQLLYYLNKQHPDKVPAPCCVPKGYKSLSFLRDDGIYTIDTFVNISAQSCQCR